jgi:hypothetical protein
VIDPSSLGALRRGTPSETMSSVIEECTRRFPRFWLDTRLDGVRPRRRFVPGEAGFDIDLRKHYSFGTLLLRHALSSISEDLKDLPHGAVWDEFCVRKGTPPAGAWLADVEAYEKKHGAIKG